MTLLCIQFTRIHFMQIRVLQGHLQVLAEHAEHAITKPGHGVRYCHSPCVSCGQVLPHSHRWVWERSAVRWGWPRVGGCDCVVEVLSLVPCHSVATLPHYCYPLALRPLGAVAS
jgi:hypothetical protein